MKKRSRAINIFSMSALDLFASALGAFIIVAVLLLPYFPITGDPLERIAELRQQIEENARQVQQIAALEKQQRINGGSTMKITLNIDDELLAKAQRMTGITEKTALVSKGLRTLIERESARRLAQLGGTEPRLRPIPRRQSEPA